MREWILASLLALGGVLVVVGVADFSGGVATVVAGGLLAGWAWLFFGEVE